MLPRSCPVCSLKIVRALVPATQSWLLLPAGEPGRIATASPNTELLVLKIRFTAHVIGSIALTRAAPFPPTYNMLVSGSEATKDGCPGRETLQKVRPVLAVITLRRPASGCVT